MFGFMLKIFAILFFWVLGWKFIGEKPQYQKYVLVAAPHTSNWDFFYFKLAAARFNIKLQWMGKHSLFRGIMGPVARWLGGVPVDRRSKHNVVEQMAKEFKARSELVLTIPPEGTRSYLDHWKSGFYHIARQAGVPVILTKLDYRQKRAGIGPTLWTDGNVKEFMDKIREFYQGACAKFPENFNRIWLKEEEMKEEELPKVVGLE